MFVLVLTSLALRARWLPRLALVLSGDTTYARGLAFFVLVLSRGTAIARGLAFFVLVLSSRALRALMAAPQRRVGLSGCVGVEAADWALLRAVGLADLVVVVAVGAKMTYLIQLIGSHGTRLTCQLCWVLGKRGNGHGRLIKYIV